MLISAAFYCVLVRFRYPGALMKQLRTVTVNIFPWLMLVFWVVGGYFSVIGFMKVDLSKTTLRNHSKNAWRVATLIGLMMVGIMAVVDTLPHTIFASLSIVLVAFFSLALMPNSYAVEVS